MRKMIVFTTMLISTLFADPVLRTGQTLSYGQTSNNPVPYCSVKDDGCYRAGEEFNYTRNSIGIVTDHVTNLEWQDTSIRNLDWYDSIDCCSALTLDGVGWRLPTIRELESVVNYTKVGPSMDDIFLNTPGGNYWALTPYKLDNSNAWGVRFQNWGYSFPANKTNDVVVEYNPYTNTTSTTYYYARCVRGQSYGNSDLHRSDDIVSDRATGLEWQDNSNAKWIKKNWIGAIDFCESLSLNSYTDWRLPNQKEMLTITDRSRYNPSLDTTVFQNIASSVNNDTPSYWSSTTRVKKPDRIHAWRVIFRPGRSYYNDKNNTSEYVRCVRENILPTANAGPNEIVVVNETVTITGSGSDTDGSIASYEWKKGDTVLATTASFDYTPTSVGTDTLTLTIMDNDGASDTDTMNVTVIDPLVNTPPTADAGPDKNVEVNQTITITGSGSDPDGTIVSYEWKKENTVLATTASFDYTPNTVGTDTLTLTVTDDDGATGTDSMTVTVTDPSAPPPTGSFLDDFSSDTLSDYTTGGDGTFTYDGTNERALVATSGGTGFTFSQALTAADEGTFTFDVSTINYNGSEAEIELILYENANTYYKIINRYGGSRTGGITKYINGTRVDSRWFNHKYAQGQDYTISVDFSPSSTTVNAFGEILTINGNHMPITVSSFRIRTQNQDAAYDNIVYLPSGAPPANIPPTADAGPDKTVDVNQTITITGSGTDVDGTIVAYEWGKDGEVLAVTASFDYTPRVIGTDTLTLTVTDDNGTSDTDTMKVTVTNPLANTPPTADAGPDRDVQVGNTITITGSGTDTDGTIASYEWKKESTVLATTASFDYTPTTVGTDTLTLTVTDNEGATGTDSMDVAVTEEPAPISEIIVDNLDSQFSITGTWAESGASDEYAGSSVYSQSRAMNSSAIWTPTLPEAGSYHVYVWYSGSSSYDRDTNADYTVNHAGGSETIVIDQNQGSGDWVSLGVFSFNAGTSGNVTLVHESTTTSSTSADAVKFVLVEGGEPSNTPPIANAGPDKTVDVNQTITITGSGTDVDGTIVAYEWGKDGEVLAATASFDYTPRVIGTDTLTLTVTDDNGTSDTDTMKVTVTDPSSPPPSGDFSDDFSSNTLSEYTTGGNGTFTYDGTKERALVATSGGTGFTFSQALTAADEGTFTFDVSTINYNGSEAEIELILYENANTYYKIINRYGGSRTGGITKYINGTRVDSRWFNHKYAQGQDYTISVDFSPSSTTVNAFGEILTINGNHMPITVSSFRIRTQNQDAAYDNIVYQQ